MGVNLGDLVPRKEIKLDDLQGKIIAIDAFNALYQFLSSIRGYDGTPLKDSQGRVTSHLQGLFTRTVNLMSRGIKLVYVFDGKAPLLKIKEQERRRLLKDDAEFKFQEARNNEDFDSMHKYSKRFSRLDSLMIAESKELLRALGIPVVEAPSEAEAQAAYMCRKGHAYAASSQDYDALLFGSPRLVRNLTLSQKRKMANGKHVITFLEYIEGKQVLDTLHLTQDQLIVLGILVGTDFNIGGVKGIGPKKALKLLEEHGSDFDSFFKDLHPDFDWKEIFTVFKDMPVTDSYSLTWKHYDEKNILQLLVEEHEFSEERVLSTLRKIDESLGKKERSQSNLDSFF